MAGLRLEYGNKPFDLATETASGEEVEVLRDLAKLGIAPELLGRPFFAGVSWGANTPEGPRTQDDIVILRESVGPNDSFHGHGWDNASVLSARIPVQDLTDAIKQYLGFNFTNPSRPFPDGKSKWDE